MVPREIALAFIEEELRGAGAWLDRKRIPYRFDQESLRLEVDFEHPKVRRALLLVGDFDGYKAVPPAWTFVDPETKVQTRATSPKPGPPRGVKSSIFIEHNGCGVICAPFNRLAYGEAKGPHSDWGASTQWLRVGRSDEVKATTLGDMLAVIDLHLSASEGCYA